MQSHYDSNVPSQGPCPRETRRDVVGLNSDTGGSEPIDGPPTHSEASDAPGISHLQRRQPAEQGPSHPGVPFLRQRVWRRWTHAPSRANMRHRGLCGLSSLATCTRPAMWTRSDCVPRETSGGQSSAKSSVVIGTILQRHKSPFLRCKTKSFLLFILPFCEVTMNSDLFCFIPNYQPG